MAMDEDDSWHLELEQALNENCCGSLYSICKGRSIPPQFREKVWHMCLRIDEEADPLHCFNEIYDLPEQALLREDCQQLVDKLGNDEEDKVSIVSDFESILTHYCKSNKLHYNKGNGFVDVLGPLITFRGGKVSVYKLFEAIQNQFIPKECFKNGMPFHVFRLLLQYHEPELCTFLDTKKITPDLYAMQWFQTLFTATCSLEVSLSIWDTYFLQCDPFFVFFLGLVMIGNTKDEIVEMKDEPKEKIISLLASLPCRIECEDVSDFCALAMFFSSKTPTSFRREFCHMFAALQEETGIDGGDALDAGHALCLPVSANELIYSIDSSHNVDRVEGVRFFLVDCRPVEQYNAGHLRTAFHLDCNLMLQELQAFATAVQGLLSGQQQALRSNSEAGGEHLCFLGSGREEEDQYVHMVVASFLQKNGRYVSMVRGGYHAIHSYLGDDGPISLADHDVLRCLVCSPKEANEGDNSGIATQSSTGGVKGTNSMDLFGMIGTVMKNKSAGMKDRLIEYIVNPTGNANVVRHVRSTDKVGKRYRNMAPVFSIDDDEAGENSVVQQHTDDEDVAEFVSIHTWTKKPDVVASFDCHEVKENGDMFNGQLLVTHTHIYMLRELSQKRGMAQITVRRSLNSIAKITSKKKHPDLITFKYGTTEGDVQVISDMDRFVIPKSSEATATIKAQIMKLSNNSDE